MRLKFIGANFSAFAILSTEKTEVVKGIDEIQEEVRGKFNCFHQGCKFSPQKKIIIIIFKTIDRKILVEDLKPSLSSLDQR